jgi:hypothetical protein
MHTLKFPAVIAGISMMALPLAVAAQSSDQTEQLRAENRGRKPVIGNGD